jgi:hypothetical protein
MQDVLVAGLYLSRPHAYKPAHKLDANELLKSFTLPEATAPPGNELDLLNEQLRTRLSERDRALQKLQALQTTLRDLNAAESHRNEYREELTARLGELVQTANLKLTAERDARAILLDEIRAMIEDRAARRGADISDIESHGDGAIDGQRGIAQFRTYAADVAWRLSIYE